MQDDDAVDALFDAVRSDVAAQPPAGVWESALEAAFSAAPTSADEAGVPEMDDDPVYPDDEIVLEDGVTDVDDQDEIVLDDGAEGIVFDDGDDGIVRADGDDGLVFDDGVTDDLDVGPEEHPADDRGGAGDVDPPSDDPGDSGW
ncbi:hypothetical protein [Rhodococcus triatomae]|nr:hypothetical protein G419_22699 [Rhodococcus triatomae BKS 15-14]